MITKENTKFKINISWLIILKTILIVLLIAIEIIHLINASLIKQENYLVFYLTPSILLVTYLFVLFIIHLERLNGWKNSSLIFLFWLFISFNSTITLRTKIIQQDNDSILFYIFYFLIIVMLILSTLSEKYNNFSENDLKNQSPEESSNLLSRLTFFWINPLIKTGYKRDLVREDLWKISDKEGSKSTCNKLENVWNLKANNYIKQMRQLDTNNNNESSSFIYTKDEQEKLKLNNNNNNNNTKQETLVKLSQPSLTFALIKIYFGKFTGIVAIKLTHDILNFVRPILLE
jgi:hypothetical protein